MHAILPGSRLLLLPALAGVSALLVSTSGGSEAGSHAGARGGDLAEMEVVGVAPVDEEGASVVVLREKGGGGAVLPIFIGRSEATAIELRLHRTEATRPLTHDLLSHAIRALGGRLVRVEISEVQGDTFIARIHLSQGGRALDIDARPSDSIALALGAGAPILVARKVIESSGISKEELDRLRRRMERSSPDDDEYPGSPEQPLKL